MALRGQSYVGDPGATGTSISNTYAGAAAIQANDAIAVVTIVSNGNSSIGAFSITGGSGTFTHGAALSPALADINIASNDAFMRCDVKLAGASDVGFPTYTTSIVAAYYTQAIFVFSGRVSSSIAALFNNQVATTSSAETAVSFGYNLTGLTALSADDILVAIGIGMPFGRGSLTFSAAIAGYTNGLNGIGGHNYSPAICGLTNLNVSAGATGTLASTISASGGDTVAVGGYVFSLPAGSSGSSISPASGAAALTGNAPSMDLGIRPLTARKAWDYTKGLLVPSRKIFLPALTHG